MNPLKRLAPIHEIFLIVSGIKDLLKPIQKPTGKRIAINPAELRVWVIGHATVLINFFGTTILTDPILTKWMPFPRRFAAAAYTAADLPPIDYTVISHAHWDHLNIRTLRKLAKKTKTIVVPKNCADLVSGIKFRHVVELSWDEGLARKDATIRAFKPEHWGERYAWQKLGRGYNSYTIEKNGMNIFFCGDSAYGGFFKNVGARAKIDVALLPIGTYTPHKLLAVHMSPHDAWHAFNDLGAHHLIPIHWGSFRLSREAPDEPPRILAQLAHGEGKTDRVHILRNGESHPIVSTP